MVGSEYDQVGQFLPTFACYGSVFDEINYIIMIINAFICFY